MKLHGSLDNYIEMLRQQHGLSQEELSLLISVEQRGAMSLFELGARRPSLRALLALEVVFGLGIRDVFAGVAEGVAEDVTSRARVLLETIPESPTEEFAKKVELLSRLARTDESRVIPEWRKEL